MTSFNWRFIRLIGTLLIADGAALSIASAQKMYADPVDSNVVTPAYTLDKLSLVVNNTEDRVGARAKLCKTLSDTPCERIQYLFPQLKLDKEKNLIYLGDQSIGTLQRRGMRLTLNKDYQLRSEVVSQPVDSGFDKGTAKLLKVYLEH